MPWPIFLCYLSDKLIIEKNKKTPKMVFFYFYIFLSSYLNIHFSQSKIKIPLPLFLKTNFCFSLHFNSRTNSIGIVTEKLPLLPFPVRFNFLIFLWSNFLLAIYFLLKKFLNPPWAGIGQLIGQFLKTTLKKTVIQLCG